VGAVHDALYAAKIGAYAQGMALIAAGSRANDWGIDLREMARIWKGGCIIRAVFLDRIRQAFDREPNLANLLIDKDFAKAIKTRADSWRKTAQLGTKLGIALPAMSASLAYFDGFRRARTPANLIQGQRDFFGAHTYERLDRKGIFHTEWSGGEDEQRSRR